VDFFFFNFMRLSGNSCNFRDQNSFRIEIRVQIKRAIFPDVWDVEKVSNNVEKLESPRHQVALFA